MPLNLVSASFQFFLLLTPIPHSLTNVQGPARTRKQTISIWWEPVLLAGWPPILRRAFKVIVSRRVLGQEVKSLLIVLNHLKSCFSPFECLRTSVGLPGKPARLEPVLSSCTFSDRRVTLHQLHVYDSLDFFMVHNKLFLYTLRRGK